MYGLGLSALCLRCSLLASHFRLRCIVFGVLGGGVLGVGFSGWGLGFKFQSSDSKVHNV